MKTATAVAVAAAMCLSPAETEAASHSKSIAKLKWGGGSSGVCGAYNDENDYTMTAVGPCNPEGNTKAPYAYAWQKAVGAAITVDDTTYLTAPVKTGDNQNVQVLEPLKDSSGYIDFKSNKDSDGKETSRYVMTGGLFGDSTTGAYLGIASYLNTGTSDITTKTNDVYGAGFSSQTAKNREGEGGSKYGAPNGPYTMCITDKAATGTGCGGEARKFTPGSYKFSIYGATMGTDFKLPTLGGNAAQYLGVRMLMGVQVNEDKVKGSFDLKFNGGTKTLDTIGTDDVKDMSVSFCDKSGNCKEESFTFPDKYNVGSTENAKTDGTIFPVSETKTVKIKASVAKDADGKAVKGEMWLDYLFTAPKAANLYMIYDPNVKSATIDASKVSKAAGGTAADSSDSSNANDNGSAGFVSAQTSAVASVVAAVAAFFMI